MMELLACFGVWKSAEAIGFRRHLARGGRLSKMLV